MDLQAGGYYMGTSYCREGLFGRTVKALVAGSMALTLSAQPLLAAPVGGQIAAGSGAISQNGNTTTITQFGNKVIVNWQSFNVGSGETVQFNLASSDVVHSFWVPEFLFKRDVIPGHPNHFAVTLTTTGTYIGHCSELCGLYHSRMLFTLKVVTPQQFQAYMAAEQAAQHSSGSTQ